MSKPSRLAKLSMPRTARVLLRPRLFRKLDEARQRRVLWVVAPPGAGKTALLATWLQSRKLRHLWVQLDEADSDVATFFHYLRLAAEELGGKQRALPVFTPEYLVAPGDFARRLFRSLCKGPRAPTVIVLDDYHEIRPDSPLHAALRDGLCELPEGVTAVIMSRSEPPAALVRLQASGSLEVLSGDELALSEQEASAIADLWGYSGHDRDIVLALHARTEGWAAGLVLLLAGWRRGMGQRQPGSEEKFIFDYFAEEVLGRTDQDTQKVLLETAILPSVAGPIAVRLTGITRAEEILADLARRGHFVVRLDATTPTYQCHALFREFLLGRAEKTLARERRAALRLSAASLLEESGQAENAFQLFVQAGAWDGASRIVMANAPALLSAGCAETVARWVLGLPEEVRRCNPWFLLWLGTAQSLGEPRSARAHLEQAFELFRQAGDPTGLYLAWATVTDLLSFIELDDLAPLDHWISILDELRSRFPGVREPEVEARLVTAAFGALMHRQPWHAALDEWERRALRIALSPGDISLRLMVGRVLALYYGWWAMDLSKARLLLEALRPLSTGKQADPATAIVWQVANAHHHLHLARVDACLEAVDRGLAISAESGFRIWDPFLLSLRCWAAVTTGDLATADRTLEQMACTGERTSRLGLCAYHYAVCVVARRRGDLALAREHGRISVELAIAGGMPLAEASCRFAWALTEPPESMEAALEVALSQARRCGTRNVQSGSLLSLALAAMRRGDDETAVTLFREGFAIARSLGALHVFWLFPEEQADCCAVALQHGIEPDYVRELIRAQRLAPGERARALDAWPWELRIDALGELAVIRNGERVRSARKAQKKPLEMLRLLVAQGPRGMRQDLLAEALWPDAEGDAAHHTLKTTVYRLRRFLGKTEAIIHQDGRVALDPRFVFVDAWALERLLDLIEAALMKKAADAASVDELRGRVNALYQGDLFGGGEDDPTIMAMAKRLRGRVERCLYAS